LHQDESFKQVVICFWLHADQCTAAALQGSLPPAARGANFTLLLIGGQWSSWLDHNNNSSSNNNNNNNNSSSSSSSSSNNNSSSSNSSDLLVGSQPVHRIVHVADGRVGDAVAIVQHAERVVIMHDALNAQGGSAHTPNDKDIDIRAVNTVNDVLWPLVATTVRDVPSESPQNPIDTSTAAPIRMVHLSNSNTHLFAVLDSGCDQWSEAYARRAASSGIVRLHGFPIASARVDVVRVSIGDTGDLYKYDERYDSIDSVYVHGAVYQLTFVHFVPGRDGSCCVKYKGVPLTCMIRPHSFLVIALNDTRTASADYCAAAVKPQAAAPAEDKDQEELRFSLILRGNMFADEVFEVPLAVRTSRRLACGTSGTGTVHDENSNEAYKAGASLADSFHVTIDVGVGVGDTNN
jgi:hypothetical protein